MASERFWSPVNISTSEPFAVEALAEAAHGLAVDVSSDTDHNRTVLTLLGEAGKLREAFPRLIARAARSIDMSRHSGVHPRLGAIDVVPVVPTNLVAGDMRGAAEVALQIARAFAHADIPVFLYGAASPTNRQLPEIRKQAFDPLGPDLGPPQPHATMGATCVGARGPLVAFNVAIDCSLEQAKEIAAEARANPGIRALGFRLTSREVSQVSMNLVAPLEVTVSDAFREVKQAASSRGFEVASSEVVGAVPRAALGDLDVSEMKLESDPVLLEDLLSS